MNVDDVLCERLSKLAPYVRELRELQDVTFQEYVENKFIRKPVERTLHTAIEACLDASRRLIAQEGFRYPEDNKDVFAVPVEEGVIPISLLSALQDMAGFCNVLVHEYADLDNVAGYGVFKKRPGDFDAFAKAVVGYLEVEGTGK